MTKTSDSVEAFPEWKVTVYRAVRSAVAAGIAAAAVVQPNWSKPEEAVNVLIAAFIAGVVTALGKMARDEWGGRKTSKVNILMPV